jgi:carboxylate-amine ligase
MMVRQNKWRACRYGLEASLVDSYTYESLSAREQAKAMVRRLEPVASELNCTEYLQHINTMADAPGWAQRQIMLIEKTGDPVEAVRQLIAASRLTS